MLHPAIGISLEITLVELVKSKCDKTYFLHFELNYFTGVNRLTPLANLPHTFKNEEKDIPHLVTKKFT